MPIAVVTGASRGFGRALAVDLAKDAWNLVIDGRQAGPLEQTAEKLRSFGIDVESIEGDIADPMHRTELVQAAESLGGLDLLVNNASTLGPSPLPTLDRFPLDALRIVYEINVFAPFALLQLALPLLVRSRGTAVALSSDAAVEAYEGWGGYGSSKSALDQLYHVFANEHPDLRVYWFDPGDMRTEMHQSAFPGDDISDRPEPESVVPILRSLLVSDRPSGRYVASQLSES